MKREKKGFTLTELLVSIAIIGLLSAIVLPALHRSRDEARKAEAINELHALNTGIRMYEMDFGEYPPGNANLNANANLIASLQAGSYVNKIDEGDLKSGEMLDPWKNPYVYLNPGLINPKSYDLYSVREDGTMMLASLDGFRVGSLASVLEEKGANSFPVRTAVLGYAALSKNLTSPNPLEDQQTYNVSQMVLDALDLIRTTDYAFVAELIGINGFKTDIFLFSSSVGGGVYFPGYNVTYIWYEDDGNDANNLARAATILVHEGLHAIYDNMKTAYSVEYTVDEEYENDYISMQVWKQLKNGATSVLLDGYESYVDQGEDETKEYIKSIGAYSGLGDYPGWEQQ